jgi:hypothetical protein
MRRDGCAQSDTREACCFHARAFVHAGVARETSARARAWRARAWRAWTATMRGSLVSGAMIPTALSSANAFHMPISPVPVPYQSTRCPPKQRSAGPRRMVGGAHSRARTHARACVARRAIAISVTFRHTQAQPVGELRSGSRVQARTHTRTHAILARADTHLRTHAFPRTHPHTDTPARAPMHTSAPTHAHTHARMHPHARADTGPYTVWHGTSARRVQDHIRERVEACDTPTPRHRAPRRCRLQ